MDINLSINAEDNGLLIELLLSGYLKEAYTQKQLELNKKTQNNKT